MLVKTSELTGPALDWAVAKCKKLPLKLDPMGFSKDAPSSKQAGWWVWDGKGQNQIIGHRKMCRSDEDGYSPSTDWAQGGPIIEREELGFAKYGPKDSWKAVIGKTPRGKPHYGKTPLVAAMRCYVASKLGESVDIPDELVNG